MDIALQVVEGELLGNPNELGDGVNYNDKPFLNYFPYVAMPWSGSNPSPHERLGQRPWRTTRTGPGRPGPSRVGRSGPVPSEGSFGYGRRDART